MTYRCFNSSPTLHAPKNRQKKKSSSSPSAKTKKKRQHQSKNNKNQKQPRHRRSGIPDPIEQMHKTEKKEVPQAFLASTASNYAYISKCSVMDEQTGELHVDPKSLFSELNSKRSVLLPKIFRNSHLQYFHPSSFPNFEPPMNGTPEVAFLGRSNTGKSSLINALSSLIQQNAGGSGGSSHGVSSGGGELARTSKRPGRTQTVNYFGLVPNEMTTSMSSSSSSSSKQSPNQSKLYLVDLPGFGYAAAPDESVDEWQKKTQAFLISRASVQGEEAAGAKRITHFGQHDTSPPLKRLYLLIDSRLPEIPLLDLSVMGWCDDYGIPYTIVLTKVDRTSRAHCVKLTNQMCMRYHSHYNDVGQNEDEDEEGVEDDGDVFMDPVVYWTSAKDGLGMEELLLSVENNMFSAEDEYDDVIDDHSEEDYLSTP
ncbi:hypothetical protein ACHAXR_011963 [Thalassiosira sp. AJA248-18]